MSCALDTLDNFFGHKYRGQNKLKFRRLSDEKREYWLLSDQYPTIFIREIYKFFVGILVNFCE